MTTATHPPSSLSVFTETIISLKYLLGEIRLYVAPISVWRHGGFFLDPSLRSFDVMAAFCQMPSTARALYLPSWPTDATKAQLCFGPDTIRYVPFVTPRYYVELRGSFEEYLQTNFAAKTRHNMTRSLRKFAESNGGAIDFREYRKPEDMAGFHDAARAVSRLTYQDRLLHVGLPDTPAFVDGLVDEARQDNIRGYLLFQADTPVAFAYCHGNGDSLYYSVVGYDPSFGRWSPGTLLLLLILQRIFLEGKYRILDFGQGEAQYKSVFSTGHLVCADTYYFRRGWRNALIVVSHYLLDQLSHHLGRILAQVGLKQRVRRLFRRWL
jgi:CelD/BcsL family acetyltransferase involved in cellulose biosynthesis